MTTWIAVTLISIGAAFMLVAAIGVLRFPDVFTRMQAASKAGTLGIGCLLAAVAIHFAEMRVTAHAVVITLFFMVTSPVAMHRIARAAHRIGVPLWEGTHRDELRESLGAEPQVPSAAEDAGTAADALGSTERTPPSSPRGSE